MTLVSVASESLSTTLGLTRNALMKRILRESGLGVYGTCTSGDTNFIVDTTRLQSTQFSSDEYVDGWIRAAKDFSSVGSALENSISPITTYTPSSGTINFNPAFGTAFAVSDEYELWKFPNPRIVTDIIDQCLQTEIYLPCWSMLSEIPDFDMEQSGTTDWSSSNATVTKQTASPQMRGKRFLRVVSTSTNGYARSAIMNIEPGREYYVSALLRCSASTTTAQLIAYDETNAAAISYNGSTSSTNTVTRMNTSRIWFTFTAPSTCYQISIRLNNPLNSTTTEWDDVVFYCVDQEVISLPWWVEDKDMVKGVFQLDGSMLASSIESDELLGEPDDGRWDIINTAFGRGKLALKSRRGAMSQPIFIFGIRPEVAYTDDNTDSKLINPDYMTACVLYHLFSTIKNEPREGYLDSKFLQNMAVEWEKRWDQEAYKMQQRIQQVIDTPAKQQYYRNLMDNLGWSSGTTGWGPY